VKDISNLFRRGAVDGVLIGGNSYRVREEAPGGKLSGRLGDLSVSKVDGTPGVGAIMISSSSEELGLITIKARWRRKEWNKFKW
jgi:hypothetical protein